MCGRARRKVGAFPGLPAKGNTVRRSGALLIPMTLIFIYYGLWIALAAFLINRFPTFEGYFPIGGVNELAVSSYDTFEPVYSSVERTILSPTGPLRLLLATIGALIITVPVTWAYMISSRTRKLNQSFLQAVMLLPVVVTGISMIVVNSIALAFSLAGIVAAVRFRFALEQPSDALYIFVAIAIGLGSGIGALAIATVISFVYVMTTLVIWRLEYGKNMSGRFLTMLTRRDGGEDEY